MFAGATDQYLTNNGTAGSNARLNYFGRVNYGFREKYLAEFVWRYQGSYIFEDASRFGFFPGVSLGYAVSEEEFWKNNLPAVNYFKLRASLGQTGYDQVFFNNTLQEYAFLPTFSISFWYFPLPLVGCFHPPDGSKWLSGKVLMEILLLMGAITQIFVVR